MNIEDIENYITQSKEILKEINKYLLYKGAIGQATSIEEGYWESEKDKIIVETDYIRFETNERVAIPKDFFNDWDANMESLRVEFMKRKERSEEEGREWRKQQYLRLKKEFENE